MFLTCSACFCAVNMRAPTLVFDIFYNKLSLWRVVARIVPALHSSFLSNLFPDLSSAVCTTTYQQPVKGGGCVVCSPRRRGKIIAACEWAWMAVWIGGAVWAEARKVNSEFEHQLVLKAAELQEPAPPYMSSVGLVRPAALPESGGGGS